MTLRQTPLHHDHIAMGARMGEFAGYDMPLFYKDGVMKEHEWVRSHVGIFDVSHMGQVTVEGPGAAAFFERLTPSVFQSKKPGRAQYTVLTNEDGGIIDDLIVTRISDDRFFTVINAGCKEKDIAWMQKHLPKGLRLTHHEDKALIAVQGPWSERLLYEALRIDTSDLSYMNLMFTFALRGDDVYVSRLGYTGEDGFELSVPATIAADVWRKLRTHPEVKPIGLAARDSLRLEMGYALYGHDIDAATTPLEAGLGWVMGKSNTGFIGAGKILGRTPEKRRVGLRLLEKGVAREGAEVFNAAGDKIGSLTSGGFSPSLKESIGQGYLKASQAIEGQKVFVNVRGRKIPAEICAMPFVPARTKSLKKNAA